MTWKTLLAYISGSIDEELIKRDEYLAAENRILRSHIEGRLRLTNSERITLAKLGKELGRQALEDICSIVRPATVLGWHRRLVAKKFDGAKNRGPGRSPVASEVENLIVRMACDNPGCITVALSSCSFAGCKDCFTDSQCSSRWPGYTCVRTTPNIGIDNACSKGCVTAADCVSGHFCINGNCADCEVPGDCPSYAPICGTGGFCYECEQTSDCDVGWTCKMSEGVCLECIGESDCTDPTKPRCSGNSCNFCNSNTDCSRFDSTFVCQTDGQCAAP